jgi:hypothetical protein
MTEGQILEIDSVLEETKHAERCMVAVSGMIGIFIGLVAIVLGPVSGAVAASGVAVTVISGLIKKIIF